MLSRSATRPFGHCRFRQDDITRGPDLCDHGGVSLRHPAQQCGRTACRLQTGHVVIVFHQHRDAMQRTDQFAGRRQGGIQRRRIRQRVGVVDNDRRRAGPLRS